MAHQNRLANAHVVVFGGTSGIGFAIANMVLSNGAQVTISGSKQPKVDTKVELLRSFYPSIPKSHVSGIAVDLSDKPNLEANLTSMFEKATEGGRKIDHIAFTAGDGINLPKVSEATADNFLAAFTVRINAPVLIAKLLANGDYMPKSAESSFTITGGTNTHRPLPNWTFAAAFGGSAEGLVRGLAVDLAPIRTNLVHPGAIHTELFQGLLDKSTPEAIEKMKKGFSLTNDFGKPEDIAEAYGWIMKDRFVNGTTVNSDGGRLLVGSEGM